MQEKHPAVSGAFFNGALIMAIFGVISIALSAGPGENVVTLAVFALGVFLLGGAVVYLAVHGFAVVMFHQAKLSEAEEEE